MLISNKTYEKFRHYMSNGRKYIIPERTAEWEDLCFYCFGNASARFVMQEYIYRIVKVLDCSDSSIEELMPMFDDKVLPNQEWEVVAYEVAKYSVRGEEFVKAINRPLSDKVKKEIEIVLDENKNFPSQQGKEKTSNRKVTK